jgi:uncharacterized protein YkwD
MKKLLLTTIVWAWLSVVPLFADTTLEARATMLVDMLSDHKQLLPSESFSYRSNRESMIVVAKDKKPEIQILPFLYNAVAAKKSQYLYYTRREENKNHVLSIVNTIRSAMWMTGLSYHSQLDSLAERYALHIYQSKHFSHTSLSWEKLTDRIQTVTYPYALIGENLAKGYDDSEDVVQARMESPTHRANIVEKWFVHMGLWRAGWYRVQLFGRPE